MLIVSYSVACCVDGAPLFFFFFFFNDTATTEIYTLSLHDALPISGRGEHRQRARGCGDGLRQAPRRLDRKSTRLNSSHSQISYAVFCLKKKKKNSALRQAVRPENMVE